MTDTTATTPTTTDTANAIVTRLLDKLAFEPIRLPHTAFPAGFAPMFIERRGGRWTLLVGLPRGHTIEANRLLHQAGAEPKYFGNAAEAVATALDGDVQNAIDQALARRRAEGLDR